MNNLLTPEAYRATIEKYLPCVLVKCSKFTNSRHLAEIIALYAFICSYQLARILDGINTMEIIIDNLVGVIGEDIAKRPGTPPVRDGQAHCNEQLLFKWKDDLLFARRLACLKMEECLSGIQHHTDFIARNLDRELLSRITTTVMDYLAKQRVSPYEESH